MNTFNRESDATIIEPAPRSPAETLSLARAAFARERGLFIAGMSGLGIALLCLIAAVVRGSSIPPEGKMLDAATFSFGVGLFILTLALLLPLAGFSPQGRRRWRRLSYAFWVFSFVLEPLQAFRGIDPRFTEAGNAADVVLGIFFGATALLLVVLFVIFALRFFRDDVLQDYPTLRLGIRYGVVAVALSFGIGISMTVIGGRVVGDDGNLLLAHALGVHGIQALPGVALLVVWAGAAPRTNSWLHIAGVAWLAASTAALVQAMLGRPPMEMSFLTTLIAAGLAVWAVAAARSVVSWVRAAEAAPRVSPIG
jgi:hypothetical protein